MRLTKSELEIMEVLWAADEPLCRADIIAHGALILDRALAAFARGQVRASTADNLLGYLRLAQRRGTEEGNPK